MLLFEKGNKKLFRGMGLKAKDGLVGWFVGFVHPITKKKLSQNLKIIYEP